MHLKKLTDQEIEKKNKANELCVEKLIRIVHFLARNNLPVKELYPKMIKFLSDEINEVVIKQYLETRPKNTAYGSCDSCDSIIVSLNSHLKEKSIPTIVKAVDLVIFAVEATSAARKEMMGLFLSAYDEEEKELTLEFVSIASIASTKFEVLMDKVQEILLNDVSKTRFSCLEGTNTMPGESTGLQRRICYVASFSIEINCRYNRLHYALSIYLT